MKLLSKMLLMLLVAVMGMSLQSCSKEETSIVNPTSVGYGRGELSTVYYGQKSVMTIITMAASNPKSVSEEEFAAATLLANAVSSGDNELQNWAYMSDDKAIQIYQQALKSLTSGKGYSGYLPIYRFEENKEANKKEIGRITFSE